MEKNEEMALGLGGVLVRRTQVKMDRNETEIRLQRPWCNWGKNKMLTGRLLIAKKKMGA